jgi:transposase-like protein
MANPFAIAAALARMQLTLTCPHCGQKKVVSRTAKPVAFRVCTRCKKQFSDPLTKKKK